MLSKKRPVDAAVITQVSANFQKFMLKSPQICQILQANVCILNSEWVSVSRRQERIWMFLWETIIFWGGEWTDSAWYDDQKWGRLLSESDMNPTKASINDSTIPCRSIGGKFIWESERFFVLSSTHGLVIPEREVKLNLSLGACKLFPARLLLLLWPPHSFSCFMSRENILERERVQRDKQFAIDTHDVYAQYKRIELVQYIYSCVSTAMPTANENQSLLLSAAVKQWK